MTPIRAIKNQYRGVNAHLHSHFQGLGGWDSFHANHIADLMRLMTVQLLPMGYVADIQQSLQIRHLDEVIARPESDVTIYDTDPARRRQTPSPLNTKTLTVPDVMSVEAELSDYQAVGIYQHQAGRRESGEPVGWIELLSPSNKLGGQDATYYQEKRRKLLHTGIVFVEIDYLHESPSTFDRLPRYAGTSKPIPAEENSHPYLIYVVDPRPEFIKGRVYPHDFDVDDDIPIVEIPLNAGDRLTFDFGAAYNKTFEETLYGLRLVDYSQLPVNFDRYSKDDKSRILLRMAAIMKGLAEGKDLEKDAPLPTENLGFDDLLSQYKL